MREEKYRGLLEKEKLDEEKDRKRWRKVEKESLMKLDNDRKNRKKRRKVGKKGKSEGKLGGDGEGRQE